MKIERLHLDGAWSPSAIVTRILQIERDLPIPVPIEQLCERLDIIAIEDLHTEGFEAALLADGVKSVGSILVKGGRPRRRRRFSIAHELGHFLIPAHRLSPDGLLTCTSEQLTLTGAHELDRRRRMEVEANQFAALMLMPPPALRDELRRLRQPDLADIVRLADRFDVSKDSMARAYVQYHDEAVAVIVIGHGRVLRHYRNERRFPWIAVAAGQAVPETSIYHSTRQPWNPVSTLETCDPATWLAEREACQVAALSEQVLTQQNGFALILLHTELRDEDDADDGVDRVWRSRF